jgi:hypothetical protein
LKQERECVEQIGKDKNGHIEQNDSFYNASGKKFMVKVCQPVHDSLFVSSIV